MLLLLFVASPVALWCGRLNDEEVPYTVSLDLSRRVQSTNVNLYLVKVSNTRGSHAFINFLLAVFRQMVDVMRLIPQTSTATECCVHEPLGTTTRSTPLHILFV